MFLSTVTILIKRKLIKVNLHFFIFIETLINCIRFILMNVSLDFHQKMIK